MKPIILSITDLGVIGIGLSDNKYRPIYYNRYLKIDHITHTDIDKLSRQYLEGIQWTLNYYTKGLNVYYEL